MKVVKVRNVDIIETTELAANCTLSLHGNSIRILRKEKNIELVLLLHLLDVLKRS